MKLALVLALCLTAAPALAQEAQGTAPDAKTETPETSPETTDDGFSLMEEGMKLIMRGMMSEMQPTLDEMGKALEEAGPKLEGLGAELGPKLSQLIALIDDIRNYDAPVMLPNGDILIRRTAPVQPPVAPGPLPTPGPNGEIDL